MAWFNRQEKGIHTPTSSKKEAPDGLWYKTPSGNIVHMRELKNNAYVSPEDDYHVRIGSVEYFEILFITSGCYQGDLLVLIASDMQTKHELPLMPSSPWGGAQCARG